MKCFCCNEETTENQQSGKDYTVIQERLNGQY